MTPLRIALSGASGMLGGALLTALAADGHTLTRLLRRAPRGRLSASSSETRFASASDSISRHGMITRW